MATAATLIVILILTAAFVVVSATAIGRAVALRARIKRRLAGNAGDGRCC